MRFLYLFTISLTFLLATACKKDCDASNSFGGEVIDNAIVKVMGHPSANTLVTEQGMMGFKYEVSFNEGLSYSPVDFGKYSVLCQITRANCSSGYHRTASIDNSEGTVTYTIEITECDDCEAQATVYNWVLIPAVPSSYEAIFVTERN